ncbi:MAG: CAP domain-containing protein [Desulfobacterales bacterium]|nr:CAP domain-containing protein [Desulfobacterales bacterium]
MKRILSLLSCCFFLLCGNAYADFASEVIDLVNIERDAEGLPPLSYDASLATAAQGHSEDMGLQNYFSHTGLDGRTACVRITDAGYTWNYCGENIAAGQPTPEDVIDTWMASPGHRANILNPNFCDIGVGYAYVASSNYGHYWTQNFGRRSGFSACPEIATYTFSATAGAGGSIVPQGNFSIDQGSDITFTITPDAGYSVAEILVDGVAATITTSYTFENVSSNHTIAVSFAVNQLPPTANAGPDQSVVEGATVTLDGSQSSDPNDAIVSYEWNQTNGPAITLSDADAVRPTFVAAPVSADATVMFQLTVTDSGGDSDSDTVEIDITENGIQSVPNDAIALETTTQSVLGLKPDNGSHLVSLQPVDPDGAEITIRNGMPEDMRYGLLDFKIKVDIPGSSATVTVLLPEPMPQGYKWFKYSQSEGWYDYSAHVSLNGDRTQLSITLVDGGTGDDDNQQNGIIADPSGMGAAPSGSGSSGGGGGCFINTLADHFIGIQF